MNIPKADLRCYQTRLNVMASLLAAAEMGYIELSEEVLGATIDNLIDLADDLKTDLYGAEQAS